MARIEGDVYIPKKDTQSSVVGDKISRDDIVKKFGFNYEQVVVERLRCWGKLPEGHKLKFFEVAKSHEGSSGLYLVEEIIEDSWIFVQAMLNNGISTRHKHGENVIELYDPLAGESFVTVDGKEYRLDAGIPFEVFPGQVHQLKTREKPSLNLLIMKNSAHIPRNKLHIPVTQDN